MGFRTLSMESCSAGEEVAVKARKPYMITKQRERWTEEEHNRFLEALKLYGRAWQRIEEHIGTKTAIQIRSHAQKFFTKLEKEALTKGITPGKTLDIDIPPPRPKRKPSNPYPRKTCVVTSYPTKEEKQEKSLAASHSSCPNGEILNLEKGAPAERLARRETLEKATEAHENGDCTDAIPLFKDAPLASVSSKGSSANPLIFRKFVPMPQKEKKGKTAENKMDTAAEENNESKQCTSDGGDVNICRLEGLCMNSQAKIAPWERLNKHRQPEKVEKSSINDIEHVQNYPEHVPVHPVEEVKEGEQAAHSHLKNTLSATNQQSTHTNTNTFRNPSTSTVSEHHNNSPVSFIHRPPNFPPFFLPHSQDAYQSFFDTSSTFPNLIVSTLLQNPAAHAAATLAASFWPPQDSENSKNCTPEPLDGTVPGGHVNPHPSMAAVAAATVAAATAWWAMHGLFPLFHPPFPTRFPFVSAATTPSQTVVIDQVVEENQERRDNGSQVHPEQNKHMLNSESPEHLMLRRSASKSAPSSDSDESRGLEKPHKTNLKSSGFNELTSTPEATVCDSNSKGRSRKRKENCSHDSSNHSDSKAVDTVQEDPKSKEKLDESLSNASVVESSFSRYRSSCYHVNESRKEVSEEGRLAFQALFSREELPQSFSPPFPEDDTIKRNIQRGAATLSVDLNSNAHAYSSELDHVSGFNEVNLRNNDQLDKSISTYEIGNSKPKSCRMGFKPYKRCSMEANEARVNSEEEKGSKRLHMEGKTSNL